VLTAKAPAPIATGAVPRGVAALPDATSVYVTNRSRRQAGMSDHGCPARIEKDPSGRGAFDPVLCAALVQRQRYDPDHAQRTRRHSAMKT